jgi:hypothetical protein
VGHRAAVANAAVPDEPADGRGGGRVQEPVWLVRAVLFLFLVGFAAFLAREAANFVRSLP